MNKSEKRQSIYQRGNLWQELPEEIKDYIIQYASDENPIPFTAESIGKIADELEI